MKKIYFYFCVFMVLLCAIIVPVSAILLVRVNAWNILVFFLGMFGVAIFTIEACENQ